VTVILRAATVAVYTGDVALQALVFGSGIFFDKRWQGVFTVLVAVQLVMLVWSYGVWMTARKREACRILHFSEAVRPYLLLSKMAPLRRVLTNVLRTMWSTREVRHERKRSYNGFLNNVLSKPRPSCIAMMMACLSLP
jgi:hypothetical protein